MIVSVREKVLAEKFPKPFNQIQIRRIWRKKDKIDVQLRSFFCDFIASLISRIIQNDIENSVRIFLTQFLQTFTNAIGIQVCIVHHLSRIISHSIHKPKQIGTLSSICRRDTSALFAPAISALITIS